MEKYEYLNVPEEYPFAPEINQKSCDIVRTIQDNHSASKVR